MRYLGLQTGRGIAACLVVLHHISGKLAHAQPEAPLFLGGFFDFGWIGVDFFFVLSGFIIAHTLNARPRASDFLLRRLIRVYPPFWVAFGLTLAVSLALPSLRDTLRQFGALEWLLAVALLPSGDNAPVIGVAWTLHHEIMFYVMAGLWLLFPVLIALIAAALLLLPLSGVPLSFPTSFLASPLHWEFVFGILAYLAHRRIKPTTARWVVAGGTLWLLAYTTLVDPINDWNGGLRVLQFGIGFGLLTLGGAAFEWSRASNPNGPSAAKSTHWGMRFGDWSFALYLLHIPVILATLKVFAMTPLQGLALLYGAGTTAFILSVVTAAIYFTRVERPLLSILLPKVGPSRA